MRSNRNFRRNLSGNSDSSGGEYEKIFYERGYIMYPIVAFPAAKIVGVQGNAIKRTDEMLSFKAAVPHGKIVAIYSFVCFDETAKEVEKLGLDSGSMLEITAEIKHYQKNGREYDSYRIVNAEKTANTCGQVTAFFSAVGIKEYQTKKSSKGEDYSSLEVEELLSGTEKPERVFIAWGSIHNSVQKMKLKAGSRISAVTEMRSYLDDKGNQQTSFKIISMGYLPVDKHEVKQDLEKKSEPITQVSTNNDKPAVKVAPSVNFESLFV